MVRAVPLYCKTKFLVAIPNHLCVAANPIYVTKTSKLIEIDALSDHNKPRSELYGILGLHDAIPPVC